jgi:uncharacterized RDD family membrane protein YckC
MTSPGFPIASEDEGDSVLRSCPICRERPINRESKSVYGWRVCKRCRNGFANRRQLAFIIDGLLIVGLEVAVVSTFRPIAGPFVTALLVLLVASASLVLRDAFAGRSPGKLACGLRVIDERTGAAASMGQCANRNTPIALLVSGIPFCCAAIGPETSAESGKILGVVLFVLGVGLSTGHRMGDGIARTRVIPVRHADRPPFLITATPDADPRLADTTPPLDAGASDDAPQAGPVLIALLGARRRKKDVIALIAAVGVFAVGSIVLLFAPRGDTPHHKAKTPKEPTTPKIFEFAETPMPPPTEDEKRQLAELAAAIRVDAERGDAAAQRELGAAYASGEGVPKDAVEAVRWFRLSAAQGYAEAQLDLGRMYIAGEGVPKDTAEALKWIRLAAAQGDCPAQTMLGKLYFEGADVPKDLAEAAKWLRLSAAQGDGEAQTSLGAMHELGLGVSKSDIDAARLYRSAAESGHALAQFNLGRIYLKGGAVPQDCVQSYAWLSLAADGGVDEASKILLKLEKLMTPSQLSQANRITREFQPQTR